MNYPCDNCIKADVCKYKEQVIKRIKILGEDDDDIITVTYNCKFAEYRSYPNYNTSPIPCCDHTVTTILNK